MLILPRSRTGPGRQHYFPLEGLDGKPFSHVRVTMHPDGGIKRVRIMGRRVAPLAGHMEPLPSVQLPAGWDKDLPDQPRTLSGLAGAASAALSSVLGSSPMLTDASPPPPPPKSLSLQHGFLGARHLSAADLPSEGPVKVQATPLTPATFGAYGDVIASPHASGLLEQGYKSANQGTAQKYEGLSDVMSVYPTSAQAQARIHIYRCQGFDSKAPFSVRVLERHQFTKQAFLPMSKTQTDAMSGQEGYLVIVAKNGPGAYFRHCVRMFACAWQRVCHLSCLALGRRYVCAHPLLSQMTCRICRRWLRSRHRANKGLRMGPASGITRWCRLARRRQTLRVWCTTAPYALSSIVTRCSTTALTLPSSICNVSNVRVKRNNRRGPCHFL